MTLTLQAVQDTLGVWIPKVQGQYINEDWNPENEGFGAQCWDLAANWSKTLGLPVINTGYPGKWVGWAGNMVSAYPQTPAIEAAYELIQPDQPGMAGDIAVWGDSYKEYYPATHVAVLIRDANLQLLCASQNSTSSRADNPYPKWSSGPATIQYLPRRGLIGFLRPRTGGSINYQSSITPVQEEDEFMPNEEFWANLNGAIDKINNRVDMLPSNPEYWANLNGAVDNIHNRTADIGAAVWKYPIDNRNATTGALEPNKTTPETVLSYGDWRLVLVMNSLEATARGIVDAVKAAPGPDAAQVAEEAYKAFADKLSNLKLTIGTEGK